MEKIDEIKEKILNLRKMTEANGASMHEAEVAMKMAFKLMTSYGLTEEDLKKASKSDFSVGNNVYVKKYKNIPETILAAAISFFTDTKFISLKQSDGIKEVFYGYLIDVELAQYIYEVCTQALKYEWSIFSGQLPVGQRATLRKQFQLAMAQKLAERLVDLKQSCGTGTSLLVLKQELISLHLEEEMKNDQSVKKSNSNSIMLYREHHDVKQAAYEAAEKVKFNRELGAKEKRISL